MRGHSPGTLQACCKQQVKQSINSHISKPVNEGFTCFWNWQVVKAGRTIATVAVELRQKRTGKLVAVGKHIKFLSEGKEPPAYGAQSEPQSRL